MEALKIGHFKVEVLQDDAWVTVATGKVRPLQPFETGRVRLSHQQTTAPLHRATEIKVYVDGEQVGWFHGSSDEDGVVI
ncbi:hypothetical protein [Echinicola vietnamensis]|uniref:Uncharacterized protein n=1 Tax=Echinicola vietnamensis (strain DSM 17526 / LMG 23754 / KMM 6221) TaxID=926556 RepID=L0FY74_ECHVK|nr:hypothetical protein [Echinicola vietnamensis]AGA78869.1 hypothetical protein Echvi_2627 [Echinicola vietnamensis DSM 17526]